MTEPVVEVDVSDRCEHGAFSIKVSAPGVWHLAGAGRIETRGGDIFVFYPGEDCRCWYTDIDL